MDPFRDELSAAHAKIAQLEERIREIQEAGIDSRLEKSRSSQPSFLVLLAGSVLMSVVTAGVGFFILREIRQPSSSAPVSFKGIATAPAANTSDAIPPIANPGTVPSAAVKPKTNAPCNCTPGDPLCTCL